MLNGKKIVCVLPAYNAELTIEKTLRDVPKGLVDLFILVDDASKDGTLKVAEKLGKEFPLVVIPHYKNRGYGGNQKTCYEAAVKHGGEVIVMLHPDYQYEPKLLGALAWMVASGVYDVALGSRIIGSGTLAGGMPLYKYIANRVLTLFENILLGVKLSEYHTGYRAFSREVLTTLPLATNSEDFVFDNEMLVQCVQKNFKIGEISVPTKYFPEASSINFFRSVKYGFGVLRCSFMGFLGRMGFGKGLLK
jgi:glycosyltransferase involved in cell wall biosynthesis